MTFEEFKSEVREKIRDYLPEKYRTGRVDIQPVSKNNGIVLDGLYVVTGRDQVIPTVYLKDFFAEHQKGEEMKSILSRIARVYAKAQEEAPDFGEEDFKYENVKNRLTVIACNAGMNRKILHDVPHEQREDIALVYHVKVPVLEMGGGMITVHSSYLEVWGIGEEQLKKDAWENMRRETPAVFQSIWDIINGDHDGISLEGENRGPFMENEIMFALSNHDKTYGAVYMFDEKLMEKIAEKLNSNLIIIPSSIHESIILRETEELDIDYIRDIVREVNETQLEVEERLSDEVYRYDRESHDLSIVKSGHHEEDILPDRLGMDEMHNYGYEWDGMLPLTKEKALELMDCGFAVYRLYGDDTEGMVIEKEEIDAHDGLFGIEKKSWEQHLRQQNAGQTEGMVQGMTMT